MKAIIVDGEAKAELDEAMGWYEDQRKGLGLDLQNEVQLALAKVQDDPNIGTRYRNTDFQFVRTQRFPFVIYYLELADSIWIAAIAHGRRRPGYWRMRKQP